MVDSDSRRFRWARLSALSLVAALAGCSTTNDNEEQNVSTAYQALGSTQCQVGVDCSLSFSVPSGVRGDALVVSATQGVTVGSGSDVSAPNSNPAAVVGGTGEVRIEAASRVGTVWTKGKVFVGSGAVVSSSLYATSQEVQQGAIVPTLQVPSGTPLKTSWKVKFPTSSQGDVNLEPDRSRSLTPGRYGSLRVASRSTIRLATGVYYFDAIQIEPDARIEIDNRNGTALIYVRADFTHRGKIVSLGAASDAIFGAFSSGYITLGDEFDATLVAPYADVTIARPPTGTHDGQYFGRRVQLQGGVRIKAAPAKAKGPAIDGIGTTVDPGTQTPPGPIPSPDGLTVEQWQDAKNAYIQQLIDSNYTGPTVHLPAHPDATKVQQAADYTLPTNAALAQSSAPTIPARQTEKFPNTDAEQEFQADIADTESGITQQTRFSYLGQGDSTNSGTYGTPAKVENVPKRCVFSKAALEIPPTPVDNNGNPIGSLDAFTFQDLVTPVTLGNKPDYLIRKADNLGYDFDKSKSPEYDGYWFFDGRLMGGWNGVGMEGMVSAGLYAGVVAMKHHMELVHFQVMADGALMKQLDNGEVKPYFASSLETKLLGKQFDFLPHWDVSTNDPALAKLKKNLLDRTVIMFEDAAAPRVQVGPFALILNGGAQVKIPLALDLDASGPEVTVAPMFRVYVTVFAGIDVVIAQIGLKGEADIIRVDMPFKAKLKWRDYLNPESCYSSADFDVTFKSVWSTLNGNLKVSVKAWLPIIGDIDIVEEEIVSWTGLTYDTGEVNLLPTIQLPILQRSENECQLGADSCFSKATARPAGVPESWSVEVPYTNSECPDQHVYEIDMQSRGLNELWLRHVWDVTDINTEALCSDSLVQVSVFRQLANGSWDRWDQYKVLGSWENGGCETISGGWIAQGERNPFTGFPWSWVDTSGGVQKVRVAVGGGTQCEQRRLLLGVSTTPN